VNNNICKLIKVKFSIPGRIRLKITLLYKNKFFAQKLSETINSKSDIVSVNININTSNLLIIYDHEKLSENELKCYIESHFRELMLLENDENNNINSIYQSEKAITKRVTLVSAILIGMVSIGEFNVATIISIMILASPFILFYIRNKGYKLISHYLLQRKVNLQNNFIIKSLSGIGSIFIQENLIINKNVVEKFTKLIKKDNLSIRRHVIDGDIEEPILANSKILVNNLRSIGVNKIFVLSKETNNFIEYAKSALDINSLTLEEGYMRNCINDFSEQPSIIVLCTSNDKNEAIKSSVIYVYTEINEMKSKNKLSCLICESDILELPYSILLCKYMETTINTIENISLAINIIGILLAASKFIFIRGSIIIYLLNSIFSTGLLKIDIKKNNMTVLKSLK